eukprot:jgi/Botrbrau1/11936/Bobra.341_1s0003.1
MLKTMASDVMEDFSPSEVLPALPSLRSQVKINLAGLAEETRCSICLGIIKEARLVSVCMHRFCKTCIEHWLRCSPDNSCPECRTPMQSRRGARPDPRFDRLLQLLYGDVEEYERKVKLPPPSFPTAPHTQWRGGKGGGGKKGEHGCQEFILRSQMRSTWLLQWRWVPNWLCWQRNKGQLQKGHRAQNRPSRCPGRPLVLQPHHLSQHNPSIQCQVLSRANRWTAWDPNKPRVNRDPRLKARPARKTAPANKARPFLHGPVTASQSALPPSSRGMPALPGNSSGQLLVRQMSGPGQAAAPASQPPGIPPPATSSPAFQAGPAAASQSGEGTTMPNTAPTNGKENPSCPPVVLCDPQAAETVLANGDLKFPPGLPSTREAHPSGSGTAQVQVPGDHPAAENGSAGEAAPAVPMDSPVTHSVSVAVPPPAAPVPTLLGMPIRFRISDWWVPPTDTPKLPPLWEVAGAHPVGTSFQGLPPGGAIPRVAPVGCPEIHGMWFASDMDSEQRSDFAALFAEKLPLPIPPPPAREPARVGPGQLGSRVPAGTRPVSNGAQPLASTASQAQVPRPSGLLGAGLETDARKKKREREREKPDSPARKKTRPTTPAVVGGTRPLPPLVGGSKPAPAPVSGNKRASSAVPPDPKRAKTKEASASASSESSDSDKDGEEEERAAAAAAELTGIGARHAAAERLKHPPLVQVKLQGRGPNCPPLKQPYLLCPASMLLEELGKLLNALLGKTPLAINLPVAPQARAHSLGELWAALPRRDMYIIIEYQMQAQPPAGTPSIPQAATLPLPFIKPEPKDTRAPGIPIPQAQAPGWPLPVVQPAASAPVHPPAAAPLPSPLALPQPRGASFGMPFLPVAPVTCLPLMGSSPTNAANPSAQVMATPGGPSLYQYRAVQQGAPPTSAAGLPVQQVLPMMFVPHPMPTGPAAPQTAVPGGALPVYFMPFLPLSVPPPALPGAGARPLPAPAVPAPAPAATPTPGGAPDCPPLGAQQLQSLPAAPAASEATIASGPPPATNTQTATGPTPPATLISPGESGRTAAHPQHALGLSNNPAPTVQTGGKVRAENPSNLPAPALLAPVPPESSSPLRTAPRLPVASIPKLPIQGSRPSAPDQASVATVAAPQESLVPPGDSTLVPQAAAGASQAPPLAGKAALMAQDDLDAGLGPSLAPGPAPLPARLPSPEGRAGGNTTEGGGPREHRPDVASAMSGGPEPAGNTVGGPDIGQAPLPSSDDGRVAHAANLSIGLPPREMAGSLAVAGTPQQDASVASALQSQHNGTDPASDTTVLSAGPVGINGRDSSLEPEHGGPSPGGDSGPAAGPHVDQVSTLEMGASGIPPSLAEVDASCLASAMPKPCAAGLQILTFPGREGENNRKMSGGCAEESISAPLPPAALPAAVASPSQAAALPSICADIHMNVEPPALPAQSNGHMPDLASACLGLALPGAPDGPGSEGLEKSFISLAGLFCSEQLPSDRILEGRAENVPLKQEAVDRTLPSYSSGAWDISRPGSSGCLEARFQEPRPQEASGRKALVPPAGPVCEKPWAPLAVEQMLIESARLNGALSKGQVVEPGSSCAGSTLPGGQGCSLPEGAAQPAALLPSHSAPEVTVSE